MGKCVAVASFSLFFKSLSLPLSISKSLSLSPYLSPVSFSLPLIAHVGMKGDQLSALAPVTGVDETYQGITWNQIDVKAQSMTNHYKYHLTFFYITCVLRPPRQFVIVHFGEFVQLNSFIIKSF